MPLLETLCKPLIHDFIRRKSSSITKLTVFPCFFKPIIFESIAMPCHANVDSLESVFFNRGFGYKAKLNESLKAGV